MPSIFTKIISGELPSYKIMEDEHFFAFLDINPVVEGHILIVPKIETDHFFDVPDIYLNKWLSFAKPIAKAIEKSIECDRCGLTVAGLEVPHAHMHLMPIKNGTDLDLSREKLHFDKVKFLEIQQKIISNL